VQALLTSRFNVSFEDIRRAFLPAMRHRILLNFEAQAENISTDTILAQIVQDIPESEGKK
jgi:MoxR-like ATPase